MRYLLCSLVLVLAVVSSACLVSDGVRTYDCTGAPAANGVVTLSCSEVGVKRGDGR